MTDSTQPRDATDAEASTGATTDVVATDGGSDAARAAQGGPAGDDGPSTANRHGRERTESATDETVDPQVLRARVDVLTEENERLRREYVRARRSQHRRAALVMALLGVLAIGAATVFPEYREVLLALGGTGLFGGVLTYYLTPERFVAASVAERVHAAHAANETALVEDLGLRDERVYVPTPDAPEAARLFIPQRADYDPPRDPEQVLVVTDDPDGRGVAFVPTGGPLYEEFEATVTGDPAAEPATLAAQLADAVVETFELATAASTEPDLEGGRIVVTVSDPVYGDLDAPDHPIVSVVGVGLAVGLERPITASVEEGSQPRLVYEWSTEA